MDNHPCNLTQLLRKEVHDILKVCKLVIERPRIPVVIKAVDFETFAFVVSCLQ